MESPTAQTSGEGFGAVHRERTDLELMSGRQQPLIQSTAHGEVVFQDILVPDATDIRMPALQAGAATRNKTENPEEDAKTRISAADSSATFPLETMATPGFTEKVSFRKIVDKFKNMLGEYNCYVSLQNATVTGDVPISTNEFATVGSTITSGLSSLFFRKKVATSRKSVLSDINTAFEPGKLCLVIGCPASGKSALLKYISGRLGSSLDAEGKLRFNGIEVAQNIVPRISLYVPQTDSHTPVLTVEETLAFSFDCQIRDHAVKNIYAPMGIDLKTRPKVELMMHLLGLKNCKDTVVGSGSLRGVSGGEKKRVTSAEMLMGSQMVLCLDEISTGLDSAATADIVRAHRLHCHELKTTTLISLLQPPPEVFELFDDVLVMGTGGHMIYHGPVSQVRDYFSNELGFHCPPHVDFADFLVDVCADDAKVYYQQNAQFGHFAPDCIEMSSRWKRSDLCHSYIVPRFEHAGALGQNPESNILNKAPHTTEFGASVLQLFWLNLVRHVRVLSKDRQLVRQRVMQTLIQGIMLGTIFWQEENNALKIAMLFIFMAVNSMGNLYIIDIAAHKRSIFYKHRDSNFYPTLAYTTSELISEVPQVMVEVALLGGLVFWFAGFTPSTFPVFFVTLVLASLFFRSYFKALVANLPAASAAHGIAIGSMAVTFCFSGFLVTASSIPHYFMWLYWLTPYSWLLRLLCVNEFTSPGRGGEYDELVHAPNQPDKRVGDLFLEAFSMKTDPVWVSYGFAYLLSGLSLCFVASTYGLHYHRFAESAPMVVKPSGKKKTFLLGPAKRKALIQRLPSEGFMRHTASLRDGDDSAVDNFERCYNILSTLSVQPEPITLSLRQLSYTVPIPVKGQKEPEQRVLLNEISAMFVPGTMTALMGSSGAGKSTLMDVIAGRKNTGTVSGELLVNGHCLDNATFARVSGYVEQTDLHVPTETVLEALKFSAYHRLPREMPDVEKDKVVDAVVDLIELRPILNKVIGQAGGASLSVEQRKRVTIGVEMAANPSVLFLDEPTSGLDSRSARVVMRAVHRIAASGRTVLCTIHQPSYEIFSMFDRLLLLKKGGWVVYNGDMGPAQASEIANGSPINTAKHMVEYFRSCSPAVPPLVQSKNPAEYMLEVIGAGTAADGSAPHSDVDFVECYQRSAMAVAVNQAINSAPQGQKLYFPTHYSATYSRQIALSIRRWVTSYWRNVAYNLTRLVVVGLCAGLFGLSIVDQSVGETYDQPTMQSFNGAIFAGVFFTCAVQAVMAVAIIGDSKAVLYRERAACMYARWVYLLALSVAEIPWLLAITGLHAVVFYPLAHLHTDPEYVTQYVLALFLFATMFCYWGQMLSALLPTTQAATLLSGASLGIMNMYSGFFMPESAIPWPWKLFFYVSPARFGLKATMPPQFYCSLSCFADKQDPAMPISCNGLESEHIRSLADAPFNGSGPGCALMTDATGVIGQMLGLESVAKNLGVSAMTESGHLPPIRLTVWDYWSVTTESSKDDVWSFTAGMVGFLLAFRLITLLAIIFLKHVKR